MIGPGAPRARWWWKGDVHAPPLRTVGKAVGETVGRGGAPRAERSARPGAPWGGGCSARVFSGAGAPRFVPRRAHCAHGESGLGSIVTDARNDKDFTPSVVFVDPRTIARLGDCGTMLYSRSRSRLSASPPPAGAARRNASLLSSLAQPLARLQKARQFCTPLTTYPTRTESRELAVGWHSSV
jgi:hypothetical protein